MRTCGPVAGRESGLERRLMAGMGQRVEICYQLLEGTEGRRSVQ